MLVKPWQLRNALLPTLITLSGIVMAAKPVQYSNALSPMLTTLSGIVTLVIFSQPLNAKPAIVLVFAFISYSPDTNALIR